MPHWNRALEDTGPEFQERTLAEKVPSLAPTLPDHPIAEEAMGATTSVDVAMEEERLAEELARIEAKLEVSRSE